MEFRARSNRQPSSSYLSLAVLAALIAVGLTLVTCGKTTITGQFNNGMATVNVSLSDPPSCLPPAGNFKSVFITIRSVQAHISATADDNSAGWVELVPGVECAAGSGRPAKPSGQRSLLAQAARLQYEPSCGRLPTDPPPSGF